MKLDLILENVRNKYNLGLLEESEGMSEKDLLKGKIMITEATMDIRKMLVEEGTIVAVQSLLQEDWQDALASAAGEDSDGGDEINPEQQKLQIAKDRVINMQGGVTASDVNSASNEMNKTYQAQNDKIADLESRLKATPSHQASAVVDHAKTAVQPYVNQASAAVDHAKTAVQPYVNQASEAVDTASKTAGQTLDKGISYAQSNPGTAAAALAGVGAAGYGAKKLADKLRRR